MAASSIKKEVYRIKPLHKQVGRLMLKAPLFVALIGALITMSTGADTAGLDFRTLFSKLPPTSEIPLRDAFEARDETRLWYRHYPSESDTALILVHGSGTDSKYLSFFAQTLAESGIATVYTPDMRGHGLSPVKRGDIDYIEQLEDDLADFISHVRTVNDRLETVVVGGHSSGGGLAVRFAGGNHGDLASAYLLLAPYLGHDAPTVRENAGGWAAPNLSRIIPISMLNGLGITLFNGVHVLQFDLPSDYRDGSETLSYSYRLMTGFGTSDFRTDLGAVEVPLLLVAGSEDEALVASEFEGTVKPLVPQAIVETVNGASHLGLVVDEEAIDIVRRWVRRL
ncbi:alpha/beta hydrolase [Halomonas sp. HMF6819]|uniref:alpha/beta hydrolase n=1 Tax=Halomonas sp. HMF6819 TaxID=3373085 RepID=UPI0037B74936